MLTLGGSARLRLCENGFDEDYGLWLIVKIPTAVKLLRVFQLDLTEEDCTDGVDDEGDLLTDCEDQV